MSLIILDQSIETSKAGWMAFFQMLGVSAEFETKIRKERQMAGIERAKAEGTYKGRKRTVDPKVARERYKAGKNISSIALELGTTRQALYRALEVTSCTGFGIGERQVEHAGLQATT